MGFFNATATYGKGFRPTENPDEYFIKIFTGGFAGPGTAENKAIDEINKFINENKEYKTYRIISRKFNWFPSYHKFTVLFEK